MTAQHSAGKAVNIILDGYGFNPEIEIKILEELINKLDDNTLSQAIDVLEDVASDMAALQKLSDDDKLKLMFSPTPVTLFRSLLYDNDIRYCVEAAKEAFAEVDGEEAGGRLREISRKHNYAIWAADSPAIFALRNGFPTAITRTSGPEAGYEEIEPRVQGNSDTGHQQLGNLTVAAQLPLQITMSIEEGGFFEIPAFEETIEAARKSGGAINVAILLSGNKGDNGRVHSCWNHLEAFLKLCFEIHQIPTEKVRIFAMLDGRDSGPYSSMEQENDDGFLPMLKKLLARYEAEESLAWILGRSYAMDRDYDESKTEKAYDLIVRGNGTEAGSFDAAMEEVKRQHQGDATDTTILPIAVKDGAGKVRTIVSGDAFVDLNFRADRQRQIVAALLKAKPFLDGQAQSRGKAWSYDWMDDDLDVNVCCMAEYHPAFEQEYGARIAFENKAHAHNYLKLVCEHCHRGKRPFNYFLLAESTKALHVGYFVRGRREAGEGSIFEQFERRRIIGSYGKEQGVMVDDDFYKTPQMKAYEIAGVLANDLYNEDLDLAIVNFSNPDMIGHLITKHFDAVVKAIEAIDEIIDFLVPMAVSSGYHVIITADHGNADEYSPAHGSNDVLTTVCSPQGPVDLALDEDNDTIRLFDIPWAILDILGLSRAIKEEMPPVGQYVRENGLEGRSFIKL